MRNRNTVLVLFIILLITTLIVRVSRDAKEERELLREYDLLTSNDSGGENDREASSGSVGQIPIFTSYDQGIIEAGCIGKHYRVNVNDTVIYYEKAGSGKPVILLHGNGGSHKTFETLIAQLVQAGYMVFAPDSRGQGANDPLTEYHYLDMEEDIYALIQEWGLEEPALYGFSDGGITGLMLCLSHPGCLRAMAVSGANLYPEGLEASFLSPVRLANAISGDPLTEMILAEPSINPADLKTIQIPVLVTAGEHDIVRGEHTRLIASSLGDGRLEILEGETHSSYIEDSQVIGTLLINFLRQVY